MLSLLRNATKVAYVFSGGSSRCVFQIGVVEALAELGVRPRSPSVYRPGPGMPPSSRLAAKRASFYYWRRSCALPSVDLRNLFRRALAVALADDARAALFALHRPGALPRARRLPCWCP